MKINIWTCTAAAIAAGILVPATASAQRFFDSAGYGGEGMPYRDCSEEYVEEEVADQLSDAPVTLRDTTGPSDLTPEQALALAEQERSLQEQEIAQLDSLLAEMPPDYPRRAEILFRLAEAYRHLADADYLVVREEFNECINNWYSCVSDTPCYEPLPDYTGAIERYHDVVRNHGSYERADEVIFRLGETLMENEEEAEGVTFLSRLVNNYGTSGYVCDALVMMGDHYFENDLLLAARQNYDDAYAMNDCSLRTYALYKLAWVDINEDAYDEALDRFQLTVQMIDSAQDQRMDFRNQALNDMLRAYVEIPDGWVAARDYYNVQEGEDVMRRKLGMLGDLYDEQGKDQERIDLMTWFIGSYPLDSMVPQWMEGKLLALNNQGSWDNYELAARETIDYLDHRPGSRWWSSNEGETGAQSNARRLTESTLLGIITRNFQEAERLTNSPDVAHALYIEVEGDYHTFFERFPDSAEAYDQAFYYAELLYYQLANSGDCGNHWMSPTECDDFLRGAGDQYRVVVEMRPDPEEAYTHDSAIGALQVYDDFMIREVPDIDAPLPPPHLFEFPAETPLGESAQSYVDIVEWFASIFPEDELIPAASWRAASLYLRNGHVAEAANRFETIIEHHPRHQFAQEAALAAFVCYDHVEDWVNIESVARRLLDVCDDGDSEICETERLQSAIAYSMNNQAEDLMEAGRSLEIGGDELAAQAIYLQAAEKRVALYSEFPDSQWAPTALFNAAATYEVAREIETSIQLYNDYLTRYTEEWFAASEESDNLRADATFTLGLIHDSQAEFEEAATWFEAVDTYPESEDRAAASYNAGRLREAMGQFPEAIARYEHYIELEGTTDQAKDSYFVIMNIERETGNLDAAYARMQAFLDAFADDPVRRLVATYLQADIRGEQGQAPQALELFQQVYNTYGPGEMAFDESGLPAGWITEPGGNFTAEDRVSVLPYAAEARFTIAEAGFNSARNQSLEFEQGEWEQLTNNLVARGEAVDASQREMFEVLNMGDAEWAVAASTRLGQLFHDFYRDIYQLPPPDYDECLDMGGSYDQCDQLMEAYDEALYTIADPLESKALDAYANGRQVAISNSIFNEWTLLIVEEMNDIDRNIQEGGATGTVPNSSADSYFATSYILSLDAKLDDFDGFVEPIPGMDVSGQVGVDVAVDPTMTPEIGTPETGTDVAPPGPETDPAPETAPDETAPDDGAAPAGVDPVGEGVE